MLICFNLVLICAQSYHLYYLQACVDRSVEADVKTCPHCRCDLASEKLKINKNLENVLLALFPGYTVGRKTYK